jgi:hypothetical protein
MNNKDKKMIDEMAEQLKGWADAKDERAIFCVLGDGKHRLQLICGTGHELVACLCDLMKAQPKIKDLLKVAILKGELT